MVSRELLHLSCFNSLREDFGLINPLILSLENSLREIHFGFAFARARILLYSASLLIDADSTGGPSEKELLKPFERARRSLAESKEKFVGNRRRT